MNRYAEALEKLQQARRVVEQSLDGSEARIGARNREITHWQDDLLVLERAVPFYWSEKTTELVIDLMNDFDLSSIECVRELVPQDYAFHYFAELAPFSIESFDGTPYPVVAISWAWARSRKDDCEMLALTAWCESKVPAPAFCFQNRPTNVLWSSTAKGQVLGNRKTLDIGAPTAAATREIELLNRFAACAGTFLRQKLLRTESVRPMRAARKRVSREGGRVCDVNVVYMRSLEAPPPVPKDPRDPEVEKREWNWQWSVRGHARQQWYPSLGKHLPVYIHPFWKGPEDKPVKPRTTPIFSVVR